MYVCVLFCPRSVYALQTSIEQWWGCSWVTRFIIPPRARAFTRGPARPTCRLNSRPWGPLRVLAPGDTCTVAHVILTHAHNSPTVRPQIAPGPTRCTSTGTLGLGPPRPQDPPLCPGQDPPTIGGADHRQHQDNLLLLEDQRTVICLKGPFLFLELYMQEKAPLRSEQYLVVRMNRPFSLKGFNG